MRGNLILVAVTVSFIPAGAIAQIGAQVAKNVQTAVESSFANGQPSMGASPAPVAPRVINVDQQTVAKSVATFREASELISSQGIVKVLNPTFCQRFELNCGGQPWQVKQKGAQSDTDAKVASIGKIDGADTVLLIRSDNNNAKAELYVCDSNGTLLRGYGMVNNGAPSRMPADQAKAGFETEKQWWMNWLTPAAVTTTASAR